jgi:hypothetical protein
MDVNLGSSGPFVETQTEANIPHYISTVVMPILLPLFGVVLGFNYSRLKDV